MGSVGGAAPKSWERPVTSLVVSSLECSNPMLGSCEEDESWTYARVRVRVRVRDVSAEEESDA
jgi:hypothetical protein